MPVYRDKARGRFVFEFDREIAGRRVRARKVLPKTWNKTQADAYDRTHSARLYAVATGVERPQHLIEEAVAVYLTERAPQLKTGDQIEGELLLMYWAYSGKDLGQLPEVCKVYADKARKDNGDSLAPATIRNRIRYLTSACRWAWKRHAMCEHDPAARVVAPIVSNQRHDTASRRQMLQLARACGHRQTRAAIRIAFYSGMRMSEILRCEVMGDAFVLADSKNGRPRVVPIHPKLRSCCDIALPDQSTISRHWRKARALLGLDHLRFHDLRHSAASEMINSGVDLYTVGAVLGHKSQQSTQRYAHLATASLRTAVDKIGKKVPTDKKNGSAGNTRKPASDLGGPSVSRTQHQRIMSPLL
jgi:integrase